MPWAAPVFAHSSISPSAGSCAWPSSASCWAIRPNRRSTNGNANAAARCRATRWNASVISLASSRHWRSCFRRPSVPTRGCANPTRHRCSVARAHWNACCPATSPTCSWCGSIWTRSGGEATRLADAGGIGCVAERPAKDGRAGAPHHGWLLEVLPITASEIPHNHTPAMPPNDPPLHRIRWQRAYRIVSSRFPPVGVFDAIAEPKDLEALYQIEALTNPRLREEWGELSNVPKEHRVSGPGTTPLMAAFTHVNPEGSRFSDGSYGVLYLAHEFDTAVEETVYHREQFLMATKEPPIDIT